MKKSTHKRLTAWLLTLALVVTLLPGMGMTALAVEDGGEGNGPPAVEVVEPEDESNGTGETVGIPPSTEPESKEEDKTTEGEGDPSGSDYGIGDDTQPQGSMRMPVMPTAAGNYPAASSVFVDGYEQFYDPGSLYYINGDKSKRFTGDANNYNAAYNPTTGTLTLKNYNGKGISVGGVKSTNITVVLIGTNIIHDGSLTNGVGGDITITSSSGGTLSITNTLSGSNPAIGIEAGFSASYKTGNVTIKGNAKVTIDMTNNGTSTYERAYGIYAKQNITISGDASVDITCATPNNTTGGGNCNGLYAAQNVAIDTNGTIKINVTNAGKDKDNGYSFGIYPMGKATLTKVGEMEVQWKKEASYSSHSGGAVSKGVSLSDTDYAINEDTINCYASYRFGTPRTVTAGNGKLTGPGLMYPNGSGKFLAGDKVKITPNEKTGRSGEVIPFQKWTSDDVTFDKSATTASNSFTVPQKNVTVIAEHNPFDGKPTFTPTGNLNDRGVLTFKTVVNPYDGDEYFALVKVGNEGNYNNGINPNTSSQTKPYVYTYEATSRHSSSYVEPGEYYVAEKLDNWWYLSEKFTVNYVKPRPEISVSYWFDPTVFNSEEEGYSGATGRQLIITNKGEADTGPLTITVEGTNPDAFTVSPSNIKNIAAGKSATSTVRPATGLPADTYTATIKISGNDVNTLSLNVKFTVTPKMTAIPRPTANTGLVYNGTEQIGVNESAGYTLTGTYKATNVGATDYTATATLNSNYKWSDGDDTDPVTITWNIGKRNPQPTDIVFTPPTKLVYDGNRKDATAELDSKYTGAGAITISKYVNPDTGEEVQPINAGTYTVYVKVAGGSNFNAATNLNRPGLWNFTIEKASQNAPVGLTASAPTDSGGKGKINRTTANMQYNTNPDATTSWKNCTAGSIEVDPGTYYVRYKGDNNHDASPNVKVIVPEYGAGVTVSGTAVSWNAKNNALYYLYPSTMEDAAIRAEWKNDTYASGAALYTGTGGAITATTVDGKSMKAQSFSFGTIPAGKYKLVIFKPEKYVPKIVSITVDTTDYTCGQLKLWLYGDVNYDGKVDTNDVIQVNRHVNTKGSLITVGTADEIAEKKLICDINNDGIIDTNDVIQINRYINTKGSLFNNFD